MRRRHSTPRIRCQHDNNIAEAAKQGKKNDKSNVTLLFMFVNVYFYCIMMFGRSPGRVDRLIVPLLSVRYDTRRRHHAKKSSHETVLEFVGIFFPIVPMESTQGEGGSLVAAPPVLLSATSINNAYFSQYITPTIVHTLNVGLSYSNNNEDD